MANNDSIPTYGNPATPASPPTAGTPADPLLQIKTIHFAIRSDGGAGSGQSYDPYDGTSQAALAAIIASLQGTNNLHLIFGAGTYTIGSACIGMGNNWTIEGSGEDQTVFQFANGTFNTPTTTASWMFYTTAAAAATVGLTTHCSLRNFSINGNLDNQTVVSGATNGYVMAYNINAMWAVVENIRVKGVYSKPGEQFPCIIGVPPSLGSGVTTANLCPHFVTRNVKVTDCRGVSMSVVCMSNWTNIVSPYANVFLNALWDNCEVTNGTSTYCPAYGGGGFSNATIRNCRAYSTSHFATWDTGKMYNVMVTGCVGENLGALAILGGGAANCYKNFQIIGNKFSFAPSAPAQMFNIAATDPTDFVVDGNVLDTSNSTVAGSYYVLCNIAAATGRFSNNVSDTVAVMNTQNVMNAWHIYGNKTTAGKDIPDAGRWSRTAGQTGSTTINKQFGNIRLAAAATTVTLTNSLIQAGTELVCWLGNTDTTAKSVVAVVGAGTCAFTLNAAATAETEVRWRIVS